VSKADYWLSKPFRLGLAVALILATVLIPFVLFEQDLHRVSLSLVESARQHPGQLSALFVALLAADVFLPIPSSVLSALAGGALGFAVGAAAIWSGMMLGCLVGYSLGRKAGRAAVSRIVSERDLHVAQKAVKNLGVFALMASRGVPVLAESFVICAGIIQYPLPRFLVATGLSNLAVALAYAAIGSMAIEAGSYLLLFAGFVALPIAGWLFWNWNN